MDALAVSTVQTVLVARHLCLTALQASVSPCNCFRLFRFAEECGISPLLHIAERACLECVPNSEVPLHDTGFLQLTEVQLQRLLQSDALQVGTSAIAAGGRSGNVNFCGELINGPLQLRRNSETRFFSSSGEELCMAILCTLKSAALNQPVHRPPRQPAP